MIKFDSDVYESDKAKKYISELNDLSISHEYGWSAYRYEKKNFEIFQEHYKKAMDDNYFDEKTVLFVRNKQIKGSGMTSAFLLHYICDTEINNMLIDLYKRSVKQENRNKKINQILK